MIHVQEIRKSFGNLEVLKGIDLQISSGEIVSIVGPSGAGKTTLLQIMGTLDRPDSGNIRIRDTEVSTMDDRKLAAFRNREIGFVFQFHHLLPEFTALENVCIPAFIGNTPKSMAEKRAAELLDYLRLADRMDHKRISSGTASAISRAAKLTASPRMP